MVKLTVFIMLLLPVLPAKGLLIKKARDSEYNSERSYLGRERHGGDYYAVESREAAREHTTLKDPLGFEELRGSSIKRSLERDFPPPKLYFGLNMKLDKKTCHGIMNFGCQLARFKNALNRQYTHSFAYNSKIAKAGLPRKHGLDMKGNLILKLQDRNYINYTGRKFMEHRFQKQKDINTFSTGINKKRAKRSIPGKASYDDLSFVSDRNDLMKDFKQYSESATGVSSVESRVGVSKETMLGLQRNRVTLRSRYSVFKEIMKQRKYLNMFKSTDGPVDIHQTPGADMHSMYDSYPLLRGQHFVGF